MVIIIYFFRFFLKKKHFDKLNNILFLSLYKKNELPFTQTKSI